MLAGLKDMSVWTATAADGANASIERRNAHSKIVIGQVIANRMHDAASLLVVTVIRKRQYINLYLYFSLWVWVIQFNSIQFFERGKVKRRKVSVFYSVLPVDQIRSIHAKMTALFQFWANRQGLQHNTTAFSLRSQQFLRSFVPLSLTLFLQNKWNKIRQSWNAVWFYSFSCFISKPCVEKANLLFPNEDSFGTAREGR